MSEKCPKCGHHPGRDHLKMKVALAIAAGENARLQAIVDPFWTDVDCYETCQNCGHRHDAVWAADDETWLAVMGSPAGFLCPGCFHRLAADKGIHIKWCANGPDCEDCHEENARLQAIVDKLAAFDGVVPVGVYGRVKLCEQLLALATEAEKENSDVGTTM